MGHGPAIDRHEGALLPERAVVQLPGHQLLARAARSRHQYGQAAMLQPHDLVAQLADEGSPWMKRSWGCSRGRCRRMRARHPQGMSQAVGEPVSIRGKV
jgi:hypothetical protein